VATLWDQLNRVFPEVLSPEPREAINGTKLLEKVRTHLENTLRTRSDSTSRRCLRTQPHRSRKFLMATDTTSEKLRTERLSKCLRVLGFQASGCVGGSRCSIGRKVPLDLHAVLGTI